MDEMVMGEVKRVFNPEFLNRLDEIILFNPLADEDLLRIIDLLGWSNQRHADSSPSANRGYTRSAPVDSREDLRGSQLRRAAAAASAAALR